MKNKKQKMFSWIDLGLEVKRINKDNYGVFAKSDFKKGDTLAIFGGYILTHKEEESLKGRYRDSGIQIHKDFVISSKDHEEPTDFFNHSCSPNSGISGQNILVAIKDIKKGQEVCFDYAMCLYSKEYSFHCFCGSKNCRKKITGLDWKNKDLQKKYKNFFSLFLQRMIKDFNRSKNNL